MRRSASVTLGLTALTAVTVLSGCSSDPEPTSAAAACVDPSSKVRLEDSACACDDPETGKPSSEDWTEDNGVKHSCSNPSYRSYHSHSSGFPWVFFLNSSRYPAVGQSLNGYHYSTSKPSSSYLRSGLSKSGGSSLNLSKSSGSLVGKSGGSVVKGGFGGSGAKAGS